MSIIEAAAGFLLFFSKNKKNAMYILIPMHLFILFFKMVLEHQPFNSIVPWNVMTIIYLLYILSTSADVQIQKEKAVLPVSTKIVLAIFWFVLPLCSFVRLWPLELSSGMYTGKNDGVNICVKDDEKMRPFRKAYILNSKSTICEGGKVFSLAWYTHLQYSQGPINLVWYYKQLYYRLRKQYPDNDIRMFYKTYTDKKIIQVE
ncbi:hypothetical protein ACLI1A_17045 [Flavobacterium sp. RHBU_3]|uniref:hypothetical protein n=1 Tax=Flavobacterium sp. RHBU_3 TaxID=3391184 RepID=UPI0039855561